MFGGYSRNPYQQLSQTESNAFVEGIELAAGHRCSPRPSLNLTKILLSTFIGSMLVACVMILLDGKAASTPFNKVGIETIRVFEQVPIFSAKPSPESDAAWDSLLPEGRGFVLVENPSQQGLKPGIPTESGIDRYSVSMFHQLHCLGMLRESFYAAVDGRRAKIFGEAEISAAQLHTAHTDHVAHCFDYLRQAIMCCSDMTMEWAAPGGATVDGWNIPHKCKDWDAAVAWTLQHRAPHNYSGIA